MDTIVLTDKKQSFNGVNYYLCGFYYQKNGKRLHRVVWEHHNGQIPKGYHVHHKDGNRHNNDISNLELMKAHDHESLHQSTEERKAKSRESIAKAIECAKAWHGSEEGKEWHSKHGKEMWEKRELNTYKCSFCGKEFRTKNIYREGRNRFCHQNCRASYRRHRIKRESEVNNISRES